MKIIFALLFLMTVSFSAKAEVRADVTPAVTTEGQSIELVLSSDEKTADKDKLDLEKLKGDFEIGGQILGKRTSVINGQMNATYERRVTLIPLKTGQITIPSLQWGTQTSNPVLLEVHPAPSSVSQTKGDEDGLFIEAALSSFQVYENAELIYTVTLYDQLGITDGDILPPSMAGAEVQPLGNDRQYTATKNGKTYQVYERKYVLFPTQTGTGQTIQPAAFKGFVFHRRSSGKDRQLLMPFSFPEDIIYNGGLASMHKEVYVKAQPLSVDVLEKPAALKDKWWLPAKAVTMTETFQPNQEEIQAGVPVRRTIRVEAKGVLGTQLPDIQMLSGEAYKLYPEQPKKESGYDAKEGLIGIQERSFVIVPIQGGVLNLPSVELSWFNVENAQEERARVSGKKMTVVGEVVSEVKSSLPPLEQAIEAAPIEVTIPPSPYASENSWLYFLGGLSIGLAGTFLLFLFLMRQPKKRRKHLPDLYPGD